MKFKYLLMAFIVIGLGFLYRSYGYLFQSLRNLPPQSSEDEAPAISYSQPETDQKLSHLRMPAGFAITEFAPDVPGARSITAGHDGLIFVGSRPQGIVYALEDSDLDGRADHRYIVAKGLNNPNGVAYKDGSLYIAEINRIIVFHNIDSQFKNNPTYNLVTTLPEETHHGWRYLKFGPDSKLYLGIGAPCNICESKDPFAAIARLNIDGKDFEIVARGIRNTVGFAWNPIDQSLWFTENGRDQMGDNTPVDELNRLTVVGEHFGFPYCHQGSILDPKYGSGQSCIAYSVPKLLLGPHVAALGMLFYQGKMFPEEFRNRVIIAEHGSWNRQEPIGYRLTMADIYGESAANYQDFITGWLDEKGRAKGRPVDLLELSDGSILISDDYAGMIYRLTYSNK